MTLALRMGKTVRELERGMTLPEFEEWKAFAQVSGDLPDPALDARQESEHYRNRRFFELMGIEEQHT